MLIAHLGSLGPSGISLRIPWVRHAQEIADLLGFGLHGTRAQPKVLPDLAGRDVRRLGGIEEEIHHAQRMDDAAGSGRRLTLQQRRRAFPGQGCR